MAGCARKCDSVGPNDVACRYDTEDTDKHRASRASVFRQNAVVNVDNVVHLRADIERCLKSDEFVPFVDCVMSDMTVQFTFVASCFLQH